MYIALKNTEHKGVYKKEDWDDEWNVKGASFREFDNLDEALEWAHVKGLKESNSIKNKKEFNKRIVKSKVEQVVEIINTVSGYAQKGVCIATKNLGDIILVPKPLYIFNVMDTYGRLAELNYWDFISEFEMLLDNEMEDGVRRYLDYDYSILEMPELFSTVRPVNDNFIEIKCCWSKPSSRLLGEDECVHIDNLYYFERYNDGAKAREEFDYSNKYFLNADEVIGVKEINIVSDNNVNILKHFGEKMYEGLYNFNVCIGVEEYDSLIDCIEAYNIICTQEDYDFDIDY